MINFKDIFNKIRGREGDEGEKETGDALKERTISGARPHSGFDLDKTKSTTTLKAQARDRCPYCEGTKIIKRGFRKRKHSKVQLYKCKSCNKTFTAERLKGKGYPLKVIFDAVSMYNIGWSVADTAKRINRRYGFNIAGSTVSNWVDELSDLCTYKRLRKAGKELFSPHQIIKKTRLRHRQVYEFAYHQGKLALTLKEHGNKKLYPIKELLEALFYECPHRLFRVGDRASSVKADFDMTGVVVSEKHNFANRIAEMAVQAVSNSYRRHEVLQKFMLANDSVTVAMELPVYLTREDIMHFRESLGFSVPYVPKTVLTGHIDLIQIRNRAVHILDYKPRADYEKPISQLTLYALALSRMTGLKLFDIKCAWFDKKKYYEFFPLHVVYKKDKRGRRKAENTSKFEFEE